MSFNHPNLLTKKKGGQDKNQEKSNSGIEMHNNIDNILFKSTHCIGQEKRPE